MRIPSGGPPATAPASSPSRGCPAASTAPTTRISGSSRPMLTISRPMRPAAPQTTMSAASGTGHQVVLAQRALELGAVLGAHRSQREAELLGAEADEHRGRLHRNGRHLE